MAPNIIGVPPLKSSDLTSEDLPSDLADTKNVYVTLNPYDRIFLTWFQQHMYMRISFDEFVRFRLYFSQDTFQALKPLDVILRENHDTNYRVVHLETLSKAARIRLDPIFEHYDQYPYPLSLDQYSEKTLGLVNLLYAQEFSQAGYATLDTIEPIIASRTFLKIPEPRERSFEQMIKRSLDEKSFGKAVRLINQYPDREKYLFQLANAYIKNDQTDQGLEAMQRYLKVVDLTKKPAIVEFIGYTYLRKKNDNDKALEYFEQLQQPSQEIQDVIDQIKILGPLRDLNKKMFFETPEEYQLARRQVIDHLTSQLNNKSLKTYKLEPPYARYLLPNMIHAYFNQSNVRLFRLISQLYRKLYPDLEYTAPHCQDYQAPKPGERRIRVGFLSNNFKNHSVTHSSSGVIFNLDRSKYEVSLITFEGAVQKDFMWTALYHSDSNYVVIKSRLLSEYQRQVGDLKLDILVYCDLGMNTHTYLMSFARLAPVQMLTWGHSDTSGVDTVDYYISSRLFELPDAQQNYTERLMLHNSLSTYYYSRLHSNKLQLDRNLDHYMIPQGHFLMILSASIQKFHPDFDWVLARVLKRCPNARLLVLVSGTKKIGDPNQLSLYQRWRKTIPPEQFNQMQFMYHLSYDQFLNLIQLSDLVLDTYPFGSCNTALDAFSVGRAVVACPSRLVNGRFVHGFYTKMGIQECLIETLDDYVGLAHRCYSDREFLHGLEQQILERRGCLYRDGESVTEWEKSFDDALGRGHAAPF